MYESVTKKLSLLFVNTNKKLCKFVKFCKFKQITLVVTSKKPTIHLQREKIY